MGSCMCEPAWPKAWPGSVEVEAAGCSPPHDNMVAAETPWSGKATARSHISIDRKTRDIQKVYVI